MVKPLVLDPLSMIEMLPVPEVLPIIFPFPDEPTVKLAVPEISKTSNTVEDEVDVIEIFCMVLLLIVFVVPELVLNEIT